jgi:hypothetical protein
MNLSPESFKSLLASDALAHQFEALNHRPKGLGHVLHPRRPAPEVWTVDAPKPDYLPGWLLRCSGDPMHTIGELVSVPDDWEACPVENPSTSAFCLADGQESLDVNNPVCCICGAPLII